MPEAKFPCPCCGFLTLLKKAGSYELCPICDWVDDPVQLRHPSADDFENFYSLWATQQRCLLKFPLTLLEMQGFQRDQRWRPLQRHEVMTENTPEGGKYPSGAFSDEPLIPYWLRES